MPIEIQEITIQMRVGEREQESKTPAAATEKSSCSDHDRAAITEDVVRRVLDILKTIKER